MARIAAERDQNIADDGSDSSTDEDFNPEAVDPEAREGGSEEYDSDAADRSTDSEDRGVSKTVFYVSKISLFFFSRVTKRKKRKEKRSR